MATFRQGEDLILEIIVLDNNNAKVDLAESDKIRVGLIIKNQIVQKYLDSSLEPAISGYGDVTVDGVDSSKLNVSVTREQSKLFPIGELSANVLIEIPDTALDGIAFEFTFLIGSVLKGYLKDEDLSL